MFWIPETRYSCIFVPCTLKLLNPKLGTFEWWISGLMLYPLFFLISMDELNGSYRTIKKWYWTNDLLSKNVTEQSILLYDRFFENKWSNFFSWKIVKKDKMVHSWTMNKRNEKVNLPISNIQVLGYLIFLNLDTWISWYLYI